MTDNNQSFTPVGHWSWDEIRGATERKLTAYPGAEIAFKRLISNGIGREQLLDRLISLGIAKRMVSQHTDKEKKWATLRGAPEGMTWGQFSRFPKQLQELARTIEKINNSPYYDPSRWFCRSATAVQGGGRDLVAELKAARANAGHLDSDYFLQLPIRLLAYATFLEIVAQKVGNELRRNRPKKALDWRRYRDELATYVRTHCKGQKRLDDLAILISAALGTEKEVEPETLRKQILRKKRRPHPVRQLF